MIQRNLKEVVAESKKQKKKSLDSFYLFIYLNFLQKETYCHHVFDMKMHICNIGNKNKIKTINMNKN